MTAKHVISLIPSTHCCTQTSKHSPFCMFYWGAHDAWKGTWCRWNLLLKISPGIVAIGGVAYFQLLRIGYGVIFIFLLFLFIKALQHKC